MGTQLYKRLVFIASCTSGFAALAALSSFALADEPYTGTNAPAAKKIDTAKKKTAKAASDAKASSPTDAKQPDTDAAGAERVNVDTIKEKYWARGDESEIGVVQNRLYSKAHRFELGVLGSIVSTDPMLSVYNVMLTFGYHFNEYFSVHALAMKDYSGPSDTQTKALALKNPSQVGSVFNTNPPLHYYGGELEASLLYGKLSVVGSAIIYYDLHLLGGVGMMATESGNDLAEHLGIGQQFYLSKNVTLNIDYRLMRYSEEITEQVVTAQLGNPLGERTNLSHIISLGLSFMFGFGK